MFERYYQRGTPATTLMCAQWDGANRKDVRDFVALFAPGTNWTVQFNSDGYPIFYKNGVSTGSGPAPGDWLLGLEWENTSSPALENDVNFHANWARALS